MWSQLQMLTVAAGELLAGGRSADGRRGPRAAACACPPGRGRRRTPARCGRRRSRSRRSRRSRRACRSIVRRSHAGYRSPVRRSVPCASATAARRPARPGLAARCSTERSILVQPLGRDRAARPAPAVQHRPADRRRGGRRPPSSASATSSTPGCCRRSPTRSPTSTPGRPARSGCRPSTLLAVLDDIGRCVAHDAGPAARVPQRPRRQLALLSVANRELRLHHGLMTFLAHPGVPPDQGGTSPAERARAWASTAAPTRRR